MFQVVSRNTPNARALGPDQTAGGARDMPRRRHISIVAREVQELREDLSAYRAQGAWYELRRATAELRRAERELDGLVAARLR